MRDMEGRTVFITGASRGIGAAMALRCAEAGANVVIAAKTADPHPKLPGTIYSVAEECEKAGGRALPVQMDLRNVEDIEAAVQKAATHFGGIDVLINNASAQTFTKTPDTTPRQFDLMFDINVRGTFFASQACIPHLRKSANPQIPQAEDAAKTTARGGSIAGIMKAAAEPTGRRKSQCSTSGGATSSRCSVGRRPPCLFRYWRSSGCR